MKELKDLKIVKVSVEDCYGYVEFDDGSKLWYGKDRSAFPNVLIRPDGSRFRIDNLSFPACPPWATGPSIMIPDELHTRFTERRHQGWSFWGLQDGKFAAITDIDNEYPEKVMVNGEFPLQAALYPYTDAGDLEAVIRSYKGPIEHEWSDEMTVEFVASGAPQ